MADKREDIITRIERKSPLAFPRPHFMAFAPLDCWARLLLCSGSRFHLRYILRVIANLFTSIIGTAITLPERVFLSPLLQYLYKKTNGKLHHKPGIVVILGYYRSGTTHLHYMLNCDPQFVTPRWCQVLAPQGFILSWAFLRLFLIPFLSDKRPQDDVTIGPEWPAEDDFALNNWTLASTLPERIILPHAHVTYAPFHSLTRLSAKHLKRWRQTQYKFIWKIKTLAGKHQKILLKTPSHTARITELQRMFGIENVKFIMLRRNPDDVVSSNVAMLQRLSIYSLQTSVSKEIITDRVTRELEETESIFDQHYDMIPEGHLAEMQFQDLVADPDGEMKRVYQQLSLSWSDQLDRRLGVYLNSVQEYRPQFGNEKDREQKTAIKQNNPATNQTTTIQSLYQATIPVFAAIICAVAWVLISYFMNNRYDWLVWPTGITIGYAILKQYRIGSVMSGLWAVILTAIVAVTVAFPNTRLIYYSNRETVAMIDIWLTTKHELTAGPTLFWMFMGMMTAYRFGSRKQVSVPGSNP